MVWNSRLDASHSNDVKLSGIPDKFLAGKRLPNSPMKFLFAAFSFASTLTSFAAVVIPFTGYGVYETGVTPRSGHVYAARIDTLVTSPPADYAGETTLSYPFVEIVNDVSFAPLMSIDTSFEQDADLYGAGGLAGYFAGGDVDGIAVSVNRITTGDIPSDPRTDQQVISSVGDGLNRAELDSIAALSGSGINRPLLDDLRNHRGGRLDWGVIAAGLRDDTSTVSVPLVCTFVSETDSVAELKVKVFNPYRAEAVVFGNTITIRDLTQEALDAQVQPQKNEAPVLRVAKRQLKNGLLTVKGTVTDSSGVAKVTAKSGSKALKVTGTTSFSIRAKVKAHGKLVLCAFDTSGLSSGSVRVNF